MIGKKKIYSIEWTHKGILNGKNRIRKPIFLVYAPHAWG